MLRTLNADLTELKVFKLKHFKLACLKTACLTPVTMFIGCQFCDSHMDFPFIGYLPAFFGDFLLDYLVASDSLASFQAFAHSFPISWSLAKRSLPVKRRNPPNLHLANFVDAWVAHKGTRSYSMIMKLRLLESSAISTSVSEIVLVPNAAKLKPIPQPDDRWQKLDIPPPPKHYAVILYIDQETGSKVTLERDDANGRMNAPLMTLYLYRLGAPYRVRRFLGLLSTLHVANVPLCSETPSVGIRESTMGTSEYH